VPRFRLLTWRKRHLLKTIATYIHQLYSNGHLKLKNMDWFVVCDSIHMHCVWIFIWDVLYRLNIWYVKTKKTYVQKTFKKNLTKNNYGLIMSHIFISPYHNHFWVDFNFYFLNMYVKKLFKMVVLQMGYLVH
jgi:hypothetical protein